MESGSVSIDEATPTQPGVELWSKSLPVIVGAASRDEEPVLRVQVALLGPRRRFGVLTAKLAAEIVEFATDDIDWRGRFLLLAHIVQHCVGLWNVAVGPNLGREVQCLKLAADGLKAKQIAITLGIGQKTVQLHLSRACEKLNCSNTVQAVVKVAQFGLLPDIAPPPAAVIPTNPKTLA